MARKDPTIDLDLTNLADCNNAIQILLHSRQGLKSWFRQGMKKCSQVLERFSEPLKFGDKAIELTENAFQTLQKYYPNLHDCNVKLQTVYEARLTTTYVESEADKNLRKDIMKNLEDSDNEYEQMLFDIQDLLDRQNLARHESRVTEMHRDQSGIFQDTVDDEGGPKRIFFKDQANFQPSIKISVNNSTAQFKKWMEEIKAYFDISHVEVLSHKQQQILMNKWVEDSFWILIQEKITDETHIWPSQDKNGTSVIELLTAEHVKKHPQTIDRSKFFNYVQGDKQNDLRYIAEMRKLFDQNKIDDMNGQQILAYHVLKGLKNMEVKKSVLKEVKANDSEITMDMIEEAVNVQTSVQAFSNFGNSQPPNPSSCNKLQTEGKGKGKGKGKGNAGKNGKNNGKADGKKQNPPKKDDKKLKYVDFNELTGKEKLDAMKARGFCRGCMKKEHPKGEDCEGREHKCLKCDKSGHLDKCCAFPKPPKDKSD